MSKTHGPRLVITTCTCLPQKHRFKLREAVSASLTQGSIIAHHSGFQQHGQGFRERSLQEPMLEALLQQGPWLNAQHAQDGVPIATGTADFRWENGAADP